jgi:hypothetical protein
MQSESELLELQKNRIQFFSNNYFIIKEHHLVTGKKVYLGLRNNNKCRFCGNNSQETTFKKIAHALPEFIGNKSLLTNEECDPCNEKFSRTLEDHFAKYISLYRVFSKTPGKRGIPSYKDQKLKIEPKTIGWSIILANENVIKVQEYTKQINFDSTIQPYVPLAVFKCLTKMAISIMPQEELIYFKEAIQWIQMEDHSFDLWNYSKQCFFAYTNHHGIMPYNKLHTFLIKRKDTNCLVPYMIYVVAFANLFFQITVPCPAQDQIIKDIEHTLHWFPVPFDISYPNIKTQYAVRDFSSKELVRDEVFEVSMNYEYIE